MTLGIVYHMPFWQTADGAIWEAEGSFARYVDSRAPYFDEILLAVPVFDVPPACGTRVRASNVRLAPLPYCPGPRQFYPRLAGIYGRLRRFMPLKRRTECCSPCQLCPKSSPKQAIEPSGAINMDECFYSIDCQVIHSDANECPPLVNQARRNRKNSIEATTRIPAAD